MNDKRYYVLDGVRGILAIAVVLHHYALLYHVDWMGKAWISVDAFFILSGFVIAHSYTIKIQTGMNLFDFGRSRLLRLYPMYISGLVIGFFGILFEMSQSNITLLDLLISLASGIIIIPYVNDLGWPAAGNINLGAAFPLNVPAWSLFFELFVNLLFFWWIVYFSRKGKIFIICTAFTTYFLFAKFFGLHSGWSASNLIGGFPRVILYFSLGYFIYSIHTKVSFQKKYKSILLLIVLLCGFALKNRIVEYLLLLLISPILIIIGSRTYIEGGTRFSSILTWLGSISYPIYITHYPLARFSDLIFQRIEIGPEASVLLGSLFALAMAIPLMKLEPIIRRGLASIFKLGGVGRAT